MFPKLISLNFPFFRLTITRLLSFFACFFFVSYSFFSLISLYFPGRDYLVLFFLVSIILLTSKKLFFPRVKLYFLLLLAVLLCGILPAIFQAHFLEGILGAYFTLQFCFVFLIFQGINLRTQQVLQILKFVHLFLFFLCCCALGIAAWNQSFFAYGINSFFRDGGAAGSAFPLGFILSLFLFLNRKRFHYFFSAIVFFLTIIISNLRKSITEAFLIWFLYIFTRKYRNSKQKIIRVVFIFLIIAVVSSFLFSRFAALSYELNFSDPMAMARSALYFTAGKIFIDYFPFGSGFGSFASIPSNFPNYSGLYYQYGLNNVIGLRPEDTGLSNPNNFMLDTYWPHIVAELGFVGLLPFLILWLWPIWNVRKFIFSGFSKLRALAFFPCAVILATSVEGLGSYYPEAIPNIIIFSGFSGAICNILQRRKKTF